jgi:hypothetical protein
MPPEQALSSDSIKHPGSELAEVRGEDDAHRERCDQDR